MTKAGLSIIIPVHNERENIKPLYEELTAVLNQTKIKWEILFIDDGSTDGSSAEIKGLETEGHVQLLRLTRCFGQSAALACGFEHARGATLITMDADAQNDPQDIPALLQELEKGFDVVCGWRRRRQDNFLRTLASSMANRLIRLITETSLNDFGCTLRAYRKEALGELQIMGDMHRLLPAYLAWAGAKITQIPVNHRPRLRGRSKYGLISRTWKVILDAFLLKFYFSYLTRPMHLFGLAAFVLLLASVLVQGFVIFRRLALGGEWISPMFFIGFFLAGGAVLFLFLGALADVLSRSFLSTHKIKAYRLMAEPDSPC